MQKTVRSTLSMILAVTLATGLAGFLAVPIAPAHAVTTNTFQPCDIFTAIGYGQINWYRPNTCPGIPSSVTFEGTLQVPQSGTGAVSNTYMTGMDFDIASCESAGTTGGIANPNPGVPCLYATMFDSYTIAVFDNTGAYLGTCGAAGSINNYPESIETVPGTGGVAPGIVSGGPGFGLSTAYITTGPLPCSSGSSLTFNTVTGGTSTGGTDWIQVEPDHCTVLYDGEGTAILSNNICTHTQNADFVSSGFDYIYAFKLLSDGGLVVADTANVALVSDTGTVTGTCDSSSAGSGGIFSLDVLPGGAAFATGSFSNNQVDYLTISGCASGQASPTFSFQSVQPEQSTSGLYGVTIYGEVEVVHPALTTQLSATSITAGGSVTDTATLGSVSSSAGGTITFYYSGSDTCPQEGATQVGSPITVSGPGTYGPSSSQTFSTPGTYYWYAYYSGSGNNPSLTSDCEPLTVTPSTTTTSTISTTKTTTSISTPEFAGGLVSYVLLLGSIFPALLLLRRRLKISTPPPR